MSKFHLLESVPVNLIQQPVERAAIIIWLIAFAQFFTYAPGPSLVPALSWFLTAAGLMIASIVIAIRSHHSMPLLIAFLSGAMAILIYFNPEIYSLVSWLDTMNRGLLYVNLQDKHRSLMILGLYTLIFWMIMSRFLQSRYFLVLQQLIDVNNEKIEFDNTQRKLSQKFARFTFLSSFIVVNAVLVFSLMHPDLYSLISLSVAIVFLFVSGQHLSEGKRGILLPVYITLLLTSYLLVQSETNALFAAMDTNAQFLDADLMPFVIWSFLLCFGHDFVSQHYNRIFLNLQITTTLWPWFGLIILAAFLFEASLALIMRPFYLMILIAYLFLMLRNTSVPFIAWSLILLLSWLMLVVWFPVNSDIFSNESLSHLGRYGQKSLMFCFSLLLFGLLWERYFNPFFSHYGWHKISFRTPVLGVSFFVTMLWFVINIVLITGLITGWYDLMAEGLAIEMTTVLVIALFIMLSFFMNNQLLANLIHASLIFLLVVLWGVNKPVPIYTLFAVIHLIWVILPSLTAFLYQHAGERFKLVYPEHFIKTSVNWIYISFVAATVNLFHLADDPYFGIETFAFLSSVGILFAAALLLARRYANGLWTVFSYLLATGLVLSLRFMFLGDVPVNAYDTAGILLISLLLSALNRLGLLPSPLLSKKWLSQRQEISSDVLVKVLPLTALFTIPWQTASLHSSVTLFLLGLFYLVNQKGSRLSLYTGGILINMAVYLWMPLLSDYSHLMLFYVIPVSASLLFISHLHKDEMKAELQNKIRFIALSLLYLVVTADIFISSSLLLFFVGLFLGLASTIYGISSKTRAFLYTGIGFIIINILGQMIVFYPEDRLGRALILMTTGAVITGLMVWFNIKRELLLSKIQLFRADLDQWH